MKNKSVIICVSIGAALALVVSIIWLFVGSLFMGGFIAGFMEALTGEVVEFSLESMVPGIVFVAVQTLIAFVMIGIGVFISIPRKETHNYTSNGIWLIVFGVLLLIVNILLFVTSILFIIGGILALTDKSDPAGQVQDQIKDDDLEVSEPIQKME